MAESPRPHEVAHPTPFTYLKVAVILAVLTGVEVGVFYIDALEPAFLPIFLVLSVVKFFLVVLFYMHLKFDSRLFSGVFVGGLLLAVAVVVVLMSLFQVISTVASAPEGLVAAAEGLPPEPPPEVAVPQVPVTQEPPTEATVEVVQPEPTVEVVKPKDTAQPQDSPSTDLVGQGQEIFMTAPAEVGVQPLWCSLCHTIEGVAAGLIGPDLTHIATDAANRKPGMSAKEYITKSITEPEVFVATGVDRATAGLMTTAITQGLTDLQVDALVAFLMEQK